MFFKKLLAQGFYGHIYTVFWVDRIAIGYHVYIHPRCIPDGLKSDYSNHLRRLEVAVINFTTYNHTEATPNCSTSDP